MKRECNRHTDDEEQREFYGRRQSRNVTNIRNRINNGVDERTTFGISRICNPEINFTTRVVPRESSSRARIGLAASLDLLVRESGLRFVEGLHDVTARAVVLCGS